MRRVLSDGRYPPIISAYFLRSYKSLIKYFFRMPRASPIYFQESCAFPLGPHDMNGKLYKQARHYMQARLFTDFAMMHLKFFPYVIWLKRVYLRRQNLSRPPVHIYGQVSKPPKLPFVKPNAPVHVRNSPCGESEAVTMRSPPRGRNCRESHRLQISSNEGPSHLRYIGFAHLALFILGPKSI